MSDVTQLLAAIEKGADHAAEELLPLVYNELRRLAAQKLSQEKPGQTLQATALVHEAWLSLVANNDPHWNGRRHFFGAAAEAMRRILIANARRKQRPKHGGGWERLDVDHLELAQAVPADELLALDDALGELAEIDPQAAELVNLRFFAGLTQQQTADLLGISRRTADRNWAYARAWLFRQIRPEERKTCEVPPCAEAQIGTEKLTLD